MFSTIKEQNVDYTQIKNVKFVKKDENPYGTIKKEKCNFYKKYKKNLIFERLILNLNKKNMF